MLSPAADPVEKVTILPSGMALGVTEQLPEAEQHLFTELQLTTQLAVKLGGRAAELVVFSQGSTGASNDLSAATQLATRMVREFGLSPSLGPIGYADDLPQHLGDLPLTRRGYSESTQRAIDEDVARLLRDAERTAVELLTKNRALLDEVTAYLLEHETVDGATIHSLAERHFSGDPAPKISPS